MMRRLHAAALRLCLSLLLMLTLPLQALAAVAPGWLPHVHAGLIAADGSVRTHAHALHLHPAGLGVHACAAHPHAHGGLAAAHDPACAGHAHAADGTPAVPDADGGDCGAHWVVSGAALPYTTGLALAGHRPVRHAGLVALSPLRLVDPPARPPRV